MATLDLETVRHSLAVARKHGFAEVELVAGDDYFSATLEPAPRGTPSAVADPEPVVAKIVAPLVGYYRPGTVELAVGATVRVGDVVAVIGVLGTDACLQSVSDRLAPRSKMPLLTQMADAARFVFILRSYATTA